MPWSAARARGPEPYRRSSGDGGLRKRPPAPPAWCPGSLSRARTSPRIRRCTWTRSSKPAPPHRSEAAMTAGSEIEGAPPSISSGSVDNRQRRSRHGIPDQLEISRGIRRLAETATPDQGDPSVTGSRPVRPAVKSVWSGLHEPLRRYLGALSAREPMRHVPPNGLDWPHVSSTGTLCSIGDCSR